MANKEHASAPCEYREFCGRDGERDLADGLCILHSTDPAKDAHAFADALAIHREHHGDSFFAFVFPGGADFAGATFSEGVSFYGATFSGEANFSKATFSKDAIFARAMFSGVAGFRERANFSRATFSGWTDFGKATFSGWADFTGATFSETAYFREAMFSERALFSGSKFSGGAGFEEVTFSETAYFHGAMFSETANFRGATFSETANFRGATFSGGGDFGETMFNGGADFGETRFSEQADFSRAAVSERANFFRARFSGKALFAGRQGGPDTDYIFAGAEVDFRQAMVDSPDAVTFLDADLTQCQFLDTDLRKVHMLGVKWPQKGGRARVYDDIASVKTEAQGRRPWTQIERLYRELKQNYEDRRDYERAGDFHYGEKQIRQQNPDTARGLRFFLTLYWLFSGYGERYLRPLLWAGVLFLGSTIGYMSWGLRPKAGGSYLAWTNRWDWLQGAYYSFRVMTFLKPDDWVPIGYAHAVNTFQTLLGPLFLGLFALALRQRLKR